MKKNYFHERTDKVNDTIQYIISPTYPPSPFPSDTWARKGYTTSLHFKKVHPVGYHHFQFSLEMKFSITTGAHTNCMMVCLLYHYTESEITVTFSKDTTLSFAVYIYFSQHFSQNKTQKVKIFYSGLHKSV